MLDQGNSHSPADVMNRFADGEDRANSSAATLIEVGNNHRQADLK